MMVKNEEHVVLDALASVEPVADHWVVLDTGSGDRTPQLLEDYRTQRPGYLHHAPFEDFASTRNVLMDLAEPTCDWMVILDADMTWEDADVLREEIHRISASGSQTNGLLVKVVDSQSGSDLHYWQVRAFRCGAGWRYRYRTHELAVCDSPRVEKSRSSTRHFATGGSRSDKYERDLRLLDLEIAERPDDPVPRYYLAGTLRSMGRYAESLREYRKTLRMLPDPQGETAYVCAFAMGEVMERLGLRRAVIEQQYAEAAALRPGRREALRGLLRSLNENRRFTATVELSELFPEDGVGADDLAFIDPAARAECRFELARAAYALGDRARYALLREQLDSDDSLPVAARAAMESWPRR